MALPAGRLNKRMVVQEPTETRDSFGDPVPTWSTYATRWVGIEYTGGSESFEGGARRTATQAVIRMRKDSLTKAITAKMRGTHDSKTYEFVSVQNVDEGNEEIRIEAVIRG